MNGIKTTGTGMLLSALLLLCASTAFAQSATPNPDAWVTDGTVYAIAQVGDTTYIGGSFDYVGPQTGRGVPGLPPKNGSERA
jgi:hypothetical protein